MYSSAFRAQAQVRFQQKGRLTSLADCSQWPLHDLLVPDGTSVGMKDKVYQISALGKGPALAVVAATSTSRHISHLFDP